MKKKYLIEVEETAHNSDCCLDKKTFPAAGWYYNTDEQNTKVLILVPNITTNSPVGIWEFPTPELMSLLGEPLKELPEAPELEAIPELTAGISEDGLIKALAVAQNPELAISLLKTE